MKISIRGLLALVLIFALAINAFLQIRSANLARSQANELRSKLPFFTNTSSVPDRYSKAWARARAYEAHMLDQNQRLVDVANAKLKKAMKLISIKPVDDKLSVLSLPAVTHLYSFPKRWQISVPEIASHELVLDFVDNNGAIQSISVAFDDQLEQVLPLEPGTHLVEVDLHIANEQKPGLLKIKFNDEVVTERKMSAKQYDGFSSYNYDYLRQKDFRPDIPVINLLHAGPSVSNTAVRVRLRKAKP